MKKTVLLLLAGSLASMSFGQTGRARLVFNNASSVYMVFNPDPRPVNNSGAYLVLDSKAPDVIVTTPGLSATGNILSEAPQNKIRWAVSDTLPLTAYVIPYGSKTAAALPVGMPFSMLKTSPGGGTGSYVFSTYNAYPYMSTGPYGGSGVAGTEWDNTQYMVPAGVSHMNDYTTGLPNNSNNAVNRFWIIDPQEANIGGLWTNYATAPSVSMTFVHDNNDVDVTLNPTKDAIVPGPVGSGGTSLSAQRFNTTLSKWGDAQFLGSIWTGGATTGQVSAVVVGGANFFKAWTLTTRSNPLPIELTNWTGVCDGKQVKLTWSTASEHSNEYFTIEKSRDAQAWSELVRVDAAGNSQSTTDYSYIDENTSGLAYYRLSQTDLDGTVTVFDVVAAGCEANSTEIVNAWDDGNDLNVVVSSTEQGVYDATLTDAQGKVMLSRPSQAISKGYTPLKLNKNGIATGVYVICLQNTNDVMTRRVMLY